jgi:hypothetical protein
VRETDHLEELGVNGRIISKWIFKKSVVGLVFVNLALDRGRWWALVNAVTNFRVP